LEIPESKLLINAILIEIGQRNALLQIVLVINASVNLRQSGCSRFPFSRFGRFNIASGIDSAIVVC
jgi:hypothetical protein